MKIDILKIIWSGILMSKINPCPRSIGPWERVSFLWRKEQQDLPLDDIGYVVQLLPQDHTPQGIGKDNNKVDLDRIVQFLSEGTKEGIDPSQTRGPWPEFFNGITSV